MKNLKNAAAILLAAAAVAAAQYAGGPVTGGGSISGTVKVKGKPPADEIRIVHKNEAQCGAKMDAHKYVVSPAGEVRWAVASIDGIAKGKAAETPSNLVYDNVNCRFEPHVLVAPAGATLKVGNNDDMLHNSHFFLMEGGAKKNLINMALPKKGQVIENNKILRKPGLVSVQCDAHEFMQGYIWVTPTPYAEVTDANGSFRMTEVPAGTHKIKVWHEALGEKVVSVTVEAGKEAKLVVEL